MYQHAKKIRLFHWLALEIWLIKKSCHLIGWEHFGPNVINKTFSQIWDLCTNLANDINFHYRLNSVKINDKISQKTLKKKHIFGCAFLVHFPNFQGKKFFSEKSGSVTHNFIWVSSTMPNLEKTNNAIPRKRPDRRKDGRTKTLFYRTLPATTGGPTTVL